MTSELLIRKYWFGTSLYLGVEVREFGSGVLGRELPVAFCAHAVSSCFPRLDLGCQSCLIRDAPGEALSAENPEFAFGILS